MTDKQKFILFLIGFGVATNQYKLIRQLDRVDFPSELRSNLNVLKNSGLINVSGYLDNGTEFHYSFTDIGASVLKQIERREIIDYLKAKSNSELLIQIVNIIYDRENPSSDLYH